MRSVQSVERKDQCQKKNHPGRCPDSSTNPDTPVRPAEKEQLAVDVEPKAELHRLRVPEHRADVVEMADPLIVQR